MPSPFRCKFAQDAQLPAVTLTQIICFRGRLFSCGVSAALLAKL